MHRRIDHQKKHRKGFSKFVIEHSDAEFQATLGPLNIHWEQWTAAFFNSAMVVPYITLGNPTHTHSFGQYSTVSSFGGVSQICIRPSILHGGHRVTRPGAAFKKGRFRFVADILLHEMIHQWQHEVQGDLEKSQAGHGPLFRDQCNAIGEQLRLQPVRIGKARGKDASLPSCSQWPHNVRPLNYYLGAVVHEHGISALGMLCRAACEFEAFRGKESLAALSAAALAYAESRQKTST